MAGVLTREEYYIQRRRETIMKYAQIGNIYAKCKSSRNKDSNLLWLVVDHFSDDAAEALTRQAPDGKSAVHASTLHTRARAKWASMRRFLNRKYRRTPRRAEKLRGCLQ